MNQLKTAFWLTLLTVLLLAAGKALGGQAGLMFALVFAVLANATAYFFSDSIVLGMYGARVVSEDEAPELHAIVRQIARTAQLPMPRVAVIDSAAPNAFATGRNPSHAVVAVTTGLVGLLSRDELSAVLGHEMGHVKNRDILISSIAAVLAGAISMLADMARWAFMFGSHRSSDDEEGAGNAGGALLMMFLAPVAAFLVQTAVSRSREFLADEAGARFSGKPMALARALQKLEMAATHVPLGASPATAHLFIVNPLTGGGFLSLFSTHPSTADRVEALERLAMEMGTVRLEA